MRFQIDEPVQSLGFLPLIPAAVWWLTGAAAVGAAATYAVTKTPVDPATGKPADSALTAATRGLGTGIGEGLGNAITIGAAMLIAYNLFFKK